MLIKIIDKLVDKIHKWTTNYKTKRKLEELRKRDPFIYQ
jgi:hypothetical protein